MAVAVSTKLELTHMSADEVLIDATRIDEAKESVSQDLARIIEEINAIQVAYQKLKSNSATTGTWKDTSKSAVKASKAYQTNLAAADKSLESSINSSVIEYVLTQIKELQNAQTVADQINTQA